MFRARSLDEFDRKVNRILEREFTTLVEMGLVTVEDLIPVVEGMRDSLLEAFPVMSPGEIELHLGRLQDQCRETAYHIFNLSYTTYWN